MTIDVSNLLDGQLEAEEAKRALKETTSQPELRDRYTIYGLVGDVLRGNSTPDDGFSVDWYFSGIARGFLRVREGVA